MKLTPGSSKGFKGKMCLVISSSGLTKVGRCLGQSTIGTKDFIDFIDTSGNQFQINVSYLQYQEVISEVTDEINTGGEDPGMAYRYSEWER